ncbi:MAG: NADP-dependent oxidoreductase [Solirubrobacterales bacterium]
MRAMAIEEFGDADTITELDLPDPKLGPDGVLIAVAAAGVNPVDFKVREGKLAEAFPYRFPLILGWDVAGTVQEVGPAVTTVGKGDAVMAYARKHVLSEGTYAELVTVTEQMVAPAPASIEVQDAAGLPLAGLTAWQAIEKMDIERGSTVLVHGAAGGVGHLAVQIAVDRGLEVIGTASARNHDAVRALGASEVVDYRETDVVAAVRELRPDGVDAVFDLFGGEAQQQSLSVLRRGGHLVSLANPPDPDACEQHGVLGHYVFVRPDGEQLAGLATMIDAGSIRPDIAERSPVDQAADAHRRQEDGHVRGKQVLTVGS